MCLRSQLVLICAISTFISACGGTGSETESNGSTDNLITPEATITDPYRILSISELKSRLPKVESHITTLDGEGIWLIESSTESHYVSGDPEDTYDVTYYNHGTQIVTVREQNGDYYTTICAAPLEFNLGDAPISIEGNMLSYESSMFDTTFSRQSAVSLAVELESTHRYFHGMFEHQLDYIDGAQSTYMTHLAGVKISNNNTLTEAASAFDIEFYLRVNSAEKTLTDLSEDITCLGGSVGVGTGSDNELSLAHEEDYGSAHTSAGDKVEFFYQDSATGDNREQAYIFNQSIIDDQGDPFADGFCGECTPHKAGSLTVTLNPESTQLAASGTGTDADDETIEWRFSFSKR